MEARKIFILPLPLLCYLPDLLFYRLGKQRLAPIIRPGNSELISEVKGGGFPDIFQALSRAGHRMMATPLLIQPL